MVTALPLETQPLDFRYSYTMISQEASQLGFRASFSLSIELAHRNSLAHRHCPIYHEAGAQDAGSGAL